MTSFIHISFRPTSLTTTTTKTTKTINQSSWRMCRIYDDANGISITIIIIKKLAIEKNIEKENGNKQENTETTTTTTTKSYIKLWESVYIYTTNLVTTKKSSWTPFIYTTHTQIDENSIGKTKQTFIFLNFLFFSFFFLPFSPKRRKILPHYKRSEFQSWVYSIDVKWRYE